MPALDNESKTAETAVDISDDTVTSTTAVNVGRAGFPPGATCVVQVSALSAVNFAGEEVYAYFEYTTDNSTWRRGGATQLQADASGVPLQLKEMPVTLDRVVEQHAPADLDWRVTVELSNTVNSADDFNFIGFLNHRTGQIALQD